MPTCGSIPLRVWILASASVTLRPIKSAQKASSPMGAPATLKPRVATLIPLKQAGATEWRGGSNKEHLSRLRSRLRVALASAANAVRTVTVQAHEGGMGLSRIVHTSGALAMDTSFQHVLESEVESEGAEGAAHAHTFRTRDCLNNVVNDKEAGAFNSVKEVHERGQLRAAPLHCIKNGLSRDCVEAVAEVQFEDGEPFLSEGSQGVAECLRSALGQARL